MLQEQMKKGVKFFPVFLLVMGMGLVVLDVYATDPEPTPIPQVVSCSQFQSANSFYASWTCTLSFSTNCDGGVINNDIHYWRRDNGEGGCLILTRPGGPAPPPVSSQRLMRISWTAIQNAISYNLRVEDMTDNTYNTVRTNRQEDFPASDTCDPSPHYVCENNVNTLFLAGIRVVPGHTYRYWFDTNPAIAGCAPTGIISVPSSPASGAPSGGAPTQPTGAAPCPITISPPQVSGGAFDGGRTFVTISWNNVNNANSYKLYATPSGSEDQPADQPQGFSACTDIPGFVICKSVNTNSIPYFPIFPGRPYKFMVQASVPNCGAVNSPETDYRYGQGVTFTANPTSPEQRCGRVGVFDPQLIGTISGSGDSSAELRWQYFPPAGVSPVPTPTSYNVRLDDRSGERSGLNNCPDNPPYYLCVNGVRVNALRDVLIRAGRNYLLWVEPVIPGCTDQPGGYIKGERTIYLPVPPPSEGGGNR
ncbi:MAG: hypothetical protein AABX33_05280 [Nanoarchaeota archaeon]